MDLNLTGQENAANQLRPTLNAFRNQIDLRFEIWQRLSREKQIQWVRNADTLDPLFALFIDVWRYTQKWELTE